MSTEALHRPGHRALTTQEWVAACTMAAIGGMLPTLSRIAGTYVSNPGNPLPEIGLLVGLAIFALIGIVLCIAFRQTELRQALIVGISAPGIVTNIVGGLSDGQGRAEAEAEVAALSRTVEQPTAAVMPGGLFIASAHAKDPVFTRESAVQPASTRQAVIQYSQKGLASSTPILVYANTAGRGGAERLGVLGRVSSVAIPHDTVSLSFRSGSLTKTVDVPDSGSFVVTVQVVSKATWGQDLLWALGKQRSGSVVELDARVMTAY
ncbi:hypothetical protein [Roseospira navarrensis]|uniref:Uncharacterized protein n=1 Tax=Roseospira navarrensis TaxID=140058 RepID=A0A7X1ZFM1_9PROT|nr:hypothetical protein [Roseospira navarrensis]MQX37114.1 hypothetical protein [Roseospira navarrensis]